MAELIRDKLRISFKGRREVQLLDDRFAFEVLLAHLPPGTSQLLEDEGKRHERTEQDLQRQNALLIEKVGSLELSEGQEVAIVHGLCQLEIKTGHLVAGEVRSKLDIDSASGIGHVPLRVVVLLVAELADVLHEGVGFFKGVESEALLHVVQVGFRLPAVMAAAVDDVRDDVLVHHLQLGFARFIELFVRCLQILEGLIRERVIQLISDGNSRHRPVQRHQQTELANWLFEEHEASGHECFGKHI